MISSKEKLTDKKCRICSRYFTEYEVDCIINAYAPFMHAECLNGAQRYYQERLELDLAFGHLKKIEK